VKPAALLFDFNGTLSDDEPIQYAIYSEVFAEEGRPIAEDEYFGRLAGLSDEKIVRTWMGEDRPDLVAERVRRFQARASDGSTIHSAMRTALRYAAARSQIGIVSGAARVEIETVLTAAALDDLVSVIVAADDITFGKPDPEGYVLALGLLERSPDEALAFEDSEAGVAAVKAAGIRCIAVEGTVAVERLAAADEIVSAIEVALMQRLLG
jgi:beta-phosphoglucomutase